MTCIPSLNVCAKRWSPRRTKWPEPNNWSKNTRGSVKQAEAAAQRAYDDLTAALALATETEQQLAHERQQFQQRLAELQAQVAAAPAAQRAAVVELAQHEAEAA